LAASPSFPPPSFVHQLPQTSRIEHVVVEEFKNYRPPRHFAKFNKKNAFAYGTTKYVSKRNITAYFQEVLEYAGGFGYPVVPVFHAASSDMKLLSSNRVRCLDEVCKYALDTQNLFAACFNSKNNPKPGLQGLIQDHFQLPEHLCHNASNDAVHTAMLFMLKMWSGFED
jgi:hypothetical protein